MLDAGLWGYGSIYGSHRLGIMRSPSTLPTHLFSLACFLCWKGMSQPQVPAASRGLSDVAALGENSALC